MLRAPALGDLLIQLLQNLLELNIVTYYFRSVEHVQRSLSLGLQTILLRGLGTVPGPVVFGIVIDQVQAILRSKSLKEDFKTISCKM